MNLAADLTQDDVALLASVLALFIALGALGWNFYEFRLSGPRVRVTTEFWTWPKELSGEGEGENAELQIWVRNHGRMDVEIAQVYVGAEPEGGMGVGLLDSLPDPVPFTLVANGGHRHWGISEKDLVLTMGSFGGGRDVYVTVELGTGRTVVSDPLELPDHLVPHVEEWRRQD